MFDLLEARPIYDVLGHKESVTTVKFSTKGDYFASGSEDKMVYVWKTNFDEVDEQLGIGGSTPSRNEAKVKYSIETPGDDNNVVDENVENQDRSDFCVLNFLSNFLSPEKRAQKS